MSEINDDISKLEELAEKLADEPDVKGHGYEDDKKGGHEESSDSMLDDEDMEDKDSVESMLFDTEDEAVRAAEMLGCVGTHAGPDGKFMPCETHDVMVGAMSEMNKGGMDVVEDDMEDQDMPEAKEADVDVLEIADQEVEEDHFDLLDQMDEKQIVEATVPDVLEQMIEETSISVESDTEEVEVKTLCGMTRQMVSGACVSCRGGCEAVEDMPGLAQIEAKVLQDSPEGSEVIASGYSPHDDVYVINVKGGDGVHREIFRAGDGSELGYLVVSPDSEYDETRVKSIDANEAADIALMEVKGVEVIAIDADQDFFGSPTYAVEIEGDTKSYDVYVAIDGEVLGYTEYEAEEIDAEIKELEAELELKRMYSRERRMELAESGEAMEDGSFPIVDMADLRNAIQANGRAKDVDAARAHIIKRAEALDAADMIPEEWMGEGDGKDKKGGMEAVPPAARTMKPDPDRMMDMTGGSKSDDSEKVESVDMAGLIAEFRNLTDEIQ